MVARSIRNRPLAASFVPAFGFTWAVWVPRAAGVPFGAVGQLWPWIPAAAALLAAALTGGRAAVAELRARLVRWCAGALMVRGLAVVRGGRPRASGLLARRGRTIRDARRVLVGRSAASTGRRDPLALLPLFLLVLFVTDGVGEEVAWRGFALPRRLVR